MKLKQYYLTENDCFKAGRKITVKGIMIHSTGANNPHLNRYIAPDDGLLGKNLYNNHWNQDKPDGRQVCQTVSEFNAKKTSNLFKGQI